MSGSLAELVKLWVVRAGFDARLAPDPAVLGTAFGGVVDPCRPGADPSSIVAWEERHGFQLPEGLRLWLLLSNGLYRSGPVIHPIFAIGPMVPFARVPDMIVQPESWFELGNPNLQTICIDLGYRLPGGGHPIFTSGDDASASPPRIIARSFDEWFLELMRQGGREYWFEPGFADFGEPWESHRRHVAGPPLPGRLHAYADRVARLWHTGVDERVIAASLGLSGGDVELIFRKLQHVDPDLAASRATGS
jgi:hypothetical protein